MCNSGIGMRFILSLGKKRFFFFQSRGSPAIRALVVIMDSQKKKMTVIVVTEHPGTGDSGRFPWRD